MAKLCPAGKAAQEKFKVYPSAYANMWASKYCKGKVGRKKTKKRNELEESGHLKSGLILPIEEKMVHIHHVVEVKVRKEKLS